MPGTLTISTLSDGTNSTSATNCIQGSAKAWVNFNGTTASPSTIRGSYNVSSVTKNGTGDYTVNFTNAMTDANYSFCGSGGWAVAAPRVTISPRENTFTSASIRFDCFDMGATNNDSSQISVAIFR